MWQLDSEQLQHPLWKGWKVPSYPAGCQRAGQVSCLATRLSGLPNSLNDILRRWATSTACWVGSLGVGQLSRSWRGETGSLWNKVTHWMGCCGSWEAYFVLETPPKLSCYGNILVIPNQNNVEFQFHKTFWDFGFVLIWYEKVFHTLEIFHGG